MFIGALFVIAKNWVQLKFLLISEWVNTLWYIHTMKHKAVKKRNLDKCKNIGDFLNNYTK